MIRRATSLAILVVCLTSCAPPAPWQRELHADPAMTFGSEEAADAPTQHALEYREGAGGDGAIAGGGCGCN